MRLRLIVAGLLTLLVLALVSCGSGNMSALTPGRDAERLSSAGVMLDGFEVIRYNESGFTDPALNSTLRLETAEIDGQTALIISVSDSNVNTVAVDVRYDHGKTHPSRVEFHNLLGPGVGVINAGFLNSSPGIAGVAEAGLHGFRAPAVDGPFATVLFQRGAYRQVSNHAGNVHRGNPGVVGTIIGETSPLLAPGFENLWVIDEDPADTSVAVRWTAGWHIADGDQNSEVNPADLARIGLHFMKQVPNDWRALEADYNQDGEVNAADLARIAFFFREGTTEYIVEVGDDTPGSALTELPVIPWADRVPALDPPVFGELDTAFSHWTVEFTDSTPFSFADLAALDTSATGNVRVVITPRRHDALVGTTTGTPAEIIVPVSDPTVIPDPTVITVHALTIRAEGATGGTGATDDVFSSTNNQAQVVANASLNLTLDSVAGQYDSETGSGPFNGTDALPADMTQDMYDDTLAAVRAALMWSDPEHGGAPGFRRTSDWLVFGTPPPTQGDPGLGTVFPDDDPESVGQNSEGRLTLTLAPVSPPFDTGQGFNLAFSGVTFNVRFNVTEDAEAAILDEPIEPATGMPRTTFTLNETNGVLIPLEYGSGGPPADPTTVSLQLARYDTSGVVLGTPFEFTYADPAVTPGQFFMRDVGGVGEIIALVPGAVIQAGSSYHFRARLNGVWSSANKPESTIGTAPPPDPVELEAVPNIIPFSGAAGIRLQIYLPADGFGADGGPRVRRSHVGLMNQIDNIFQPKPGTETAYLDQLKRTGPEFAINVGDDNLVYPVIIVAQGSDHNVINFDSRQPAGDGGPIWTDTQLQNSQGENGWLPVVSRWPGVVIVDLAALPPGSGGSPEDPGPDPYCFKLFNADGSVIGFGTFGKDGPLGPPSPPPSVATPNSWGVNVFNRMATDGVTLAQRDYGGATGKNTVNGNNVYGDTPDVLWFEFRDGWVYNAPSYDTPVATGNVQAIIEEVDETFGTRSMPLDLRIVGVDSVTNSFIAIRTIRPNNFARNTLGDDLGGNLMTGTLGYRVHLKDPTKPGNWQATYDKLLQVGSLPPPAP